MNRILFIIVFLILTQIGFAQDIVEWSQDVEITKSSFAGALPDLAEDDMQQYSFASTFEFNFQMANLQFAFTKNFNKYVTAYYAPHLSWIEDGALTDQLLLMANLDFDLVELYARKFRQKIFETKKVGSKVNFYNQIHDQINREYSDRQAVIQSELRSRDSIDVYLVKEIEKVNIEIEALHEYCKTCKPKKKKKQKKKKKK